MCPTHTKAMGNENNTELNATPKTKLPEKFSVLMKCIFPAALEEPLLKTQHPDIGYPLPLGQPTNYTDNNTLILLVKSFEQLLQAHITLSNL